MAELKVGLLAALTVERWVAMRAGSWAEPRVVVKALWMVVLMDVSMADWKVLPKAAKKVVWKEWRWAGRLAGHSVVSMVV